MQRKVQWKNMRDIHSYRPDEDIVEALSQHAREVLVVDGVEELRLVQVAAEGVSDAGVSQSAEGTVQLQRVVVELPQVFKLR